MNNFKPFSEAERLANNQRVLATLAPILAAHHQRTMPITPPQPAAQDSTDMLILSDLARRPFLALTQRAQSLQLIPGQPLHFKDLKRHLTALEQMKLCTHLVVRMNNRGGNSEFSILTAAGHAAINSPVKPRRGGTAYPHFWMQEFVRFLLSQRNVLAEIEPKRSHSQVDLGFTDPATSRNIGIEICLSTAAYELGKIARTLQDWERILIVAPTTDVLRDLEQHFLNSLTTLNSDVPRRVTLILPYHIVNTPRLADLYDAVDVVYQRHVAKQQQLKPARSTP